MNRKPPPIPPADRTPQARLHEGALHGIVGYQIAQAAIVTDEVFAERVGRKTDLRRVEFTILMLVLANPGVSARQLARALAVTPPNIAAWLDRLEARSLVERTRSDSDARVQHVRATRVGTALAERALQGVREGEQEALAVLSAAERAMLTELLHKVALARRS